MAILEPLWCDFVIWKPLDFCVQRIDFDRKVADDMILKAI